MGYSTPVHPGILALGVWHIPGIQAPGGGLTDNGYSVKCSCVKLLCVTVTVRHNFLSTRRTSQTQ